MAEERGGLARLKIAKKAYVFDVRKKYSLSRTFQLKKSPQTPQEQLKEAVGSLFERKKKPEGQQEAAQPVSPSVSPPDAVASAIKTAAFVALLFVVGGFIFLWMQLSAAGTGGSPPQRPEVFSGSYDYFVSDAEILSVAQEDRIGRSFFLLVEYWAENLSSLNFSASIYPTAPTTQVFLLDYAREGDDCYPAFRKSLFEGMPQSGFAISEIEVWELAALPEGATVIVPTGYLPQELLGIGSNFDYAGLLNRGVNIIYIGYPFDSLAIDRRGQTVPVKHYALSFTKVRADSTDGFRLYDPQYVASPQATGDSRLFSGHQLYGSVSVVKGAKGAMLFLPQTLDGGWRGDGKAAAEDIIRLVREALWMSPLAQTTLPAEVVGEGKERRISIFSPPFDADGGYVELSADAKDMNGIGRRGVQTVKLFKTQRGEMIPRDPKTVPFYLSGQKTRLNIKLAEPTSTPVELFIRMYKDGNLLQEEKLELGLTNPQTEKPKDFQVNAEPGRYVVHVEDRAGRVYAACQLDVIDLDIELLDRPDWGRGKFRFFLSAAGETVSPRFLTVSLDGKGEKKYSPGDYTYEDKKTLLLYEHPYEIKPGNHTFTFSAGEWSKQFVATYRPSRNFWDNPLVLFLGFISLAVFGIGYFLRKPEKMRYGLDIPDFPPLSTIKIPVKRQTVLDIFESVNASYAWQYMPLRLDELKNGFRRLTYNGKPILVGDFNLERILSRLRDEGLVKEELGYWGKTQWEKESGRSIRYLAMYRIMRNVFVNNALRFSKLGAMPDCDVKVIAGKDEIYFHIMEQPYEPIIHKALATAKKGTTMMVFKNEEERDSFANSLTSSSKLAVALKMEIQNGNILLVQVKNEISAFLKQIIK
ncbi:MAG: hypothetical protein N3E51_02335 [Candidatus Micrarchaeota archaeon]|nr:hypothetical protein [Candidatus Micrarchaeota archaeon]